MGTILTSLPPLFSPPSLRALMAAAPGPRPGRLYRCEVVFGSPSAGCRATGICRIIAGGPESRSAAQPNTCRQVPALFASGPGPDQLSMLLFREFLCAAAWKNHLRHGFLRLPEPCRLPSELVAYFDLAATELPAGLYPVRSAAGHLRLDFPLSFTSII